MPAPARKVHRQSVTLEPGSVKALERRGAQAHQTRGSLNASATINRVLAQYELMMAKTAVSLDPKFVEVLLELLPEPWDLSPTEILVLDQYLSSMPEFTATAGSRGVDGAKLLAAVAALDVAQRVVLVDQLVQSRASQQLP